MLSLAERVPFGLNSNTEGSLPKVPPKVKAIPFGVSNVTELSGGEVVPETLRPHGLLESQFDPSVLSPLPTSMFRFSQLK
jgi:hypothetical protein